MIIDMDKLLKEFAEMMKKHGEKNRPTWDCMLDFEHKICQEQQCRYCSYVRPPDGL